MSITSINNIPPDVFKGLIFPYFQPKDLPAVSLVCKLWNQYASSDTVWKPHFQNAFPYCAITASPSVKEQYKEIAEILAIYPINLFVLFGGTVEFRKLPVVDLQVNKELESYIDDFQQEQLTSPIMRGKDNLNRPFIVLKLKDKKTGALGFVCLFQYHISLIPQPAVNWACGQKGFTKGFGLNLRARDHIGYYLNEFRSILKGEHRLVTLAE